MASVSTNELSDYKLLKRPFRKHRTQRATWGTIRQRLEMTQVTHEDYLCNKLQSDDCEFVTECFKTDENVRQFN
jgi:hypothetical protein